MKKAAYLLIIVTLACLASCIRDDDWDLINHPIHLQGDVDPYLGLPVAYGQMNMGDILGMAGSEVSAYIDPDAHIITIQYDTSISYLYPINAGTKNQNKKGGRKSTEDFEVYSRTFSNTLDINLFNDIEFDGQSPTDFLNVEDMFLGLKANIKLVASDSTIVRLQNYHADLYLDSIIVTAKGKNGQTFHVFSQDRLAMPINESLLSEGVDVDILPNDFDASPIANSMPRQISYSARFNIHVDESIFANDITTFINDSLEIEAADITADISARFPLNFKLLQEVRYPCVLDLAQGNSVDSIVSSLSNDNMQFSLKDLRLSLRFDNGLPLFLKLNVIVMHDSTELCSLLESDTMLYNAPVEDPDHDGIYTANGTTRSTFGIQLNDERLHNIGQANKIKIIPSLMPIKDPTTGEYLDVAISRSDFLSIKAFLKVHAGVQFDYEIYPGRDTTNGRTLFKKGGKQ